MDDHFQPNYLRGLRNCIKYLEEPTDEERRRFTDNLGAEMLGT